MRPIAKGSEAMAVVRPVRWYAGRRSCWLGSREVDLGEVSVDRVQQHQVCQVEFHAGGSEG
eukprot:6724097-Heterocapsa_arctica.AAC.1